MFVNQSLKNRRSQQSVQWLGFHILLPQERFIRSIFQQSSYEIGHARKQISHRGIEPQATPILRNRMLKGLGHAEDHLIFPGLWREPEGFRNRFDVRQGTEIVRTEGRSNQGCLR